MPEYLLILSRSIFAFFVLLLLARWMGKMQISQLTFFDYIVGITIGSIAAELAVNQNTKILNGTVGLVVWAGLAVLLGFVGTKSYWFRRVTDGEPTIVVQNGKIHEENLRKAKLSLEQLMVQLREKNAFKLSDVEFAVLETNGELSVMKKSDAQPVTPKDLGLPVIREKEPRMVIIDGHIMKRTLENTGHDVPWLISQLRAQGVHDVTDVFAGQLDSEGNLYVDLYTDQVDLPEMMKKPMVAASLKKVQADLESFALQTQDKQAKKMYEQQSKQLQSMINQIDPYLRK
ncbi:MAG: DUF421 domain-containing protein [Bacillaceae bacterium]|nr:DUF421 domain-containing protein [Bacillaceae bacterium]